MNIKLYIILQLWIPFVELSCCGIGGGPSERVSQVSIKASSDEIHRRGVSSRTVGRQYMATPGVITTRSMTTVGSRAVGPEPMAALGVTARTAKAAEGLRAASTRSMATPSRQAASNVLKVTPSRRSTGKGFKVTPSLRAASKRTFRAPRLRAAARMHYYKKAAQIESMVNGIGARKQNEKVGGRDTVPPPGRVDPTGTVPGFVDRSIGGRTKMKRTTVGNSTTVRRTKDEGLVIGGKKPGDDAKYRYTFPDNKRKTVKRQRITASRISFKDNCDYLVYYCLKAYNTGTLCGRTVYYRYQTFKNYCVMDYVNCMERYELWLVVHTGACVEDFQELGWYEPYPYMDDYFMDQMYVLEF